MIRIEKDQWWSDRFVIAQDFLDLLRQPVENFKNLPTDEQNSLRQTQIFRHEKLRLLGQHGPFSLVKKYDGTLGWLLGQDLLSIEGTHTLNPPKLKRQSPIGFFKNWLSTPYVWGGLSKTGIDCSGFSQLYYWQVLGLKLPKNSWDQRKLGKKKDFAEVKDHDLVFCFRINGKGTHHVVIYYGHRFWHARRTGGVISQSPSEFISEYRVEAVNSLRNANSLL